MNKKFLERYMHIQPQTFEQKYLFLTDNQEIAFNIVSVGYQSIALLSDTDGFHNIDSFLQYMDDIAFSGSCHMDYCYVPACSSKRLNDLLEQYFRREHFTYRIGWTLFKNKEYLEKLEYRNEIKALLTQFILRFEQTPSAQPDLNRFHKFNDQGHCVGVLDMEIVDYLLQTVPFFVIDSIPFLYQNGCYKEDANGIILKSQIQKLLFHDCIRSTTIQRVYNLLISQMEVQRKFTDLNNHPPHWINFQNGYFDVLEWKMIEHDTRYLLTNQIPFTFYPERLEEQPPQGENIRSYLNSSMPDQTDQQTFWQYMGYCMTTDTRFQKFLMIKGKGGTGKSVAISLIQHIVGIDNCSSISLQDLNKRFYATGLFGKLLNACADIPSTAMQSIDIVKKAVGEDTLLYEKKGQDPTQFHSYAKLLFSANEMPLNLDDKTNAYYRRLLVLDMNQTISDKMKDPNLKEKICAEADYAISMAIISLRKLYLDNQFTESQHSRECIEELYRSADSVKAFLDEKMCRQSGSKIRRSDMFKYYTDYCEENDRQAHGKSVFFRMMADKGYSLKRNSEGFYYNNLGLKENDFIRIDSTEPIPFEQIELMTK